MVDFSQLLAQPLTPRRSLGILAPTLDLKGGIELRQLESFVGIDPAFMEGQRNDQRA